MLLAMVAGIERAMANGVGDGDYDRVVVGAGGVSTVDGDLEEEAYADLLF